MVAGSEANALLPPVAKPEATNNAKRMHLSAMLVVTSAQAAAQKVDTLNALWRGVPD